MYRIEELRRKFFELKRKRADLLARYRALGLDMMMTNFELQRAVYSVETRADSDAAGRDLNKQRWASKAAPKH